MLEVWSRIDIMRPCLVSGPDLWAGRILLTRTTAATVSHGLRSNWGQNREAGVFIVEWGTERRSIASPMPDDQGDDREDRMLTSTCPWKGLDRIVLIQKE